MSTGKATIVYQNGIEEVYACSRIEFTEGFIIFLDEVDNIARALNCTTVMDIYVEHNDDGLQIDFDMDDREVH